MNISEKDSLVGSIREMLDQRDEALRSDSSSRLSAYKKAIALKDIIQAVLFFGGLLYAVGLGYHDLQSKPSTEDVAKAIHDVATPIGKKAEDNATKLDDLSHDVEILSGGVELLIEEQSYHSDLLDCLATKCKQPPPKPAAIEQKRRALLLKRD